MTTEAGGFAEVLGRIPSGLFILTARRGDQETGMLASWVMQAGFEPPALTIAVRKDRYVAQWLGEGSHLVLNILAEGHKDYLKHFGRGFEPGEPAFVGLETTRTDRDLVVLAAALGHLECEIVNSVDSGDHRVFLARVSGGRLAADASPAVHIRKSGLRY